MLVIFPQDFNKEPCAVKVHEICDTCTHRVKQLPGRGLALGKLEAGGWKLEAGWRLEAGGWRLEAGGWRLEAGSLS